MATLKDELASLKIDKDDRAGGRRGGWIGLVAVVALLLAVGGGWFWSQRVQAAPVKTAPEVPALVALAGVAAIGPVALSVRAPLAARELAAPVAALHLSVVRRL